MHTVRVLVAVDRHQQDDAVLTRAIEISIARRGQLDIVHVIDLPGNDADIKRPDTLLGQAALANLGRINGAVARIDKGATNVRVHIVAGSPAERLIDICEYLKPTIIVMRSHERRNIIEKAIGSTTDRVIAAGVAPVLVVKRTVSRAYGHLLLTTDGTDDVVGALSFVTSLLPDTATTLVQVVRIAPQLEEAMVGTGMGQPALDAHLKRLMQAARDRLGRVARTVTLPTRKRVLQGDAATVLIRATRNPKVDLIALGTGTSSLIRRALLGSVTRRLVQEASCDVLIWRPHRIGDAFIEPEML